MDAFPAFVHKPPYARAKSALNSIKLSCKQTKFPSLSKGHEGRTEIPFKRERLNFAPINQPLGCIYDN
ncbi:hypothetical protein CEXT_304231 [Caerostris extrusa]|uniref:Uncharacterized protein n=1 Tax=Caerostris extrusa TaxID=172846 RepID=A0AAV4SJ25_CAEEX|nr:hypothetical protein CEXT_304231 [Caerostris extrusa]